MTPRATPMNVDDRRAMIIDAVIPVLMEQGAAVTSKQLADAAGLAEGTVFRAFGTKEALIQAAVAAYLDPVPFRESIAAIDPALPLEDKIAAILERLRARFTGIFGLMAALGLTERPQLNQPEKRFSEYLAAVAQVLGADSDRLRCSIDRLALFLRLIAFASSLKQFHNEELLPFDAVVDLAVGGLVGPTPGADADPAP